MRKKQTGVYLEVNYTTFFKNPTLTEAFYCLYPMYL